MEDMQSILAGDFKLDLEELPRHHRGTRRWRLGEGVSLGCFVLYVGDKKVPTWIITVQTPELADSVGQAGMIHFRLTRAQVKDMIWSQKYWGFTYLGTDWPWGWK